MSTRLDKIRTGRQRRLTMRRRSLVLASTIAVLGSAVLGSLTVTTGPDAFGAWRRHSTTTTTRPRATTTTTKKPTATTTTSSTSTSTTSTSTSTTTTSTTQPPATGTLLFADEFDGTALDTSKWVALNRSGDASNGEVECYTPANVTVQSGYAAMVSKVDSSCAGSSYTSGAIQWNTFNFTYGTIDIRAKLAGGSGTWPADWMIGHNCQTSNLTSADNIGTCSWPNRGSEEIDIAEMWNDSKTTLHQNLITSAGGYTCGADGLADVSQNWHTYTLVWAPGKLTWKVDGVTTCTTSVAGVPNSAMFLLLNTAMGGAHGGAIVSSTLPQTHYIDYVHVYSG